MNASDMYGAMESTVRCGTLRRSEDRLSPMQDVTMEAMPFIMFRMHCDGSLPKQRSVDVRWAVANVLHFFAATEEAAVLRKYNKRADKFLDGDKFAGAYGACAVPQLRRCVELLRRNAQSRRAVVCMGGLAEETANLPRCWSSLHFLMCEDALQLHVYQRSLSLVVMPYDCIALQHVLLAVAYAVDAQPGFVWWTVGSLHCSVSDAPVPASWANVRLLLPLDKLWSPSWCISELKEPTELPEPYRTWLADSKEVRT